MRLRTVKGYIAGVSAGTLAMLGVAIAPVMALAPGVQNGGFADGTDPGVFTTLVAPVATSNTNIPNWSVDSGSVDHIGSYWQSSDGDNRSLDMSGVNPGVISQTFDTVAGHTYTVTFDMAGNPDGAPVVKTLDVVATGGSTSTYTFDTTGHSKASMGWESHTYSFTATGVSTVLTFTSAGPNNTFFGAALDNVAVSLDAPTNKDQCKNGGWMDYSNLSFKNQGDCVSYVATHGRNLPAGL